MKKARALIIGLALTFVLALVAAKVLWGWALPALLQ
jgi:hypothetical protein